MFIRRRLFAALAPVLALAIALGGAAPAKAADVAAARDLIKSTATNLLQVVNSSQANAQKQAQLRQLVDANVDVDGVARFVLGRFWRVATPAQRADYMATFRQLLVYAVAAQASGFQGASFKMGQAQAQAAGVVVDTLVSVPGKPTATVQWVVGDVAGQPKIVDILAEGTSLRITERNDYAGVISQHGGKIQPLIDAMHQQLARFKANASG
ncbi:MlaC/ttg2D family ABC transporter substrate-binding protein [Acidisoma sp. C75]